MGLTHELVRVMHADMQSYRPQGLSVKARRYPVTNQPQTTFEDASIKPL